MAVLRQLLAVPANHFYDDLLMLGLTAERASGQQCCKQLRSLMGVQLDPEKRQDMSDKFVYTGASFDIF